MQKIPTWMRDFYFMNSTNNLPVIKNNALYYSGLGEKPILELIAQTIMQNTHIISIDILCKNNVDKEGFSFLAKTVAESTAITSCAFRFNSISLNVNTHVLNKIIHVIKKNTNLRSFLYGEHGCDKTLFAITLADAMHLKHNLTSISFEGDNNFKLMKEIESLLKDNFALKALTIKGGLFKYLSFWQLGMMAKFLSSSQYLESLDLSNNAINSYYGNEIAQALLSNRVLKSLNLSNNNINFDCLVEGLKNNHTLQYLNLINNRFNYVDANNILTLLESNASLIKIELGENSPSFKKNKINYENTNNISWVYRNKINNMLYENLHKKNFSFVLFALKNLRENEDMGQNPVGLNDDIVMCIYHFFVLSLVADLGKACANNKIVFDVISNNKLMYLKQEFITELKNYIQLMSNNKPYMNYKNLFFCINEQESIESSSIRAAKKMIRFLDNESVVFNEAEEKILAGVHSESNDKILSQIMLKYFEMKIIFPEFIHRVYQDGIANKHSIRNRCESYV